MMKPTVLAGKVIGQLVAPSVAVYIRLGPLVPLLVEQMMEATAFISISPAYMLCQIMCLFYNLSATLMNLK